MSRGRAAVALAVVLAVGSGCAREEVPPTSAPSSETTPREDGGLTGAEIEALLATGTPPERVTWLISPPDGWTALPRSSGVDQGQVGSSRCLVTLANLAGYGTAAAPDSVDVAQGMVRGAVHALGTEVVVEPAAELMVEAAVADATLEVGFAMAHLAEAGGGLEGDVIGFCDHGDTALTAHTLCAGDQYAEHGDALRDFLGYGVAVELSWADAAR